MDWNTNILTTVTPFVSHPIEAETASSFTTFLCNSNYPFTGFEGKHDIPILEKMVPPQETMTERSMMMMMSCNDGSHQEKKKRLTAVQLESLERSFQEEIKLDPERKMKLARELGLQPRQVAVWFQNRRARWRAKKLEYLYDVLKQEYDVVTREKQKLHEEVQKLRSMVMEQAHAQSSKKQLSSNYNTEASYEETVESIQSYNTNRVLQAQDISNSNSELEQNSGTTRGGGYLFNIVHDFNKDLVSPSYWASFPSSYPSK